MEILELTQLQINLLKAVGGLTLAATLFGAVGYAVWQIVKRIPNNLIEKVI